ncbi:MAG TPA: hypothetical protein VJ508_09685 [Saprospiraceae bacterium]|nr:hypothetical protein [Saprospiraceae bacterium]
MKSALFLVVMTFCWSSCSNIGSGKSGKDYLHVPGPFDLMSFRYNLIRSSHPSGSEYMQEYLPGAETPEHYTEMIVVQLVMSNENLKDLVVNKAKEIQARKNSDPYAEYNVGENKETHEVLLDYIFSEGTGEQAMAEWNICRYKPYADTKGNKGYVLLRWTRRSYGPAYQQFAEDLKTNRKTYVLPFMKLNFPAVSL